MGLSIITQYENVTIITLDKRRKNMNDTYCEYIVKRKTSSSALICRFVAVFASAVAIFLSLLMFSILGLTACGFFVWIDMVIFRNTDIEYEYQFFSGQLDIDVIYGKKKRKRARRFDLKKIEIFAPLKGLFVLESIILF